jgi:hypothetical protein
MLATNKPRQATSIVLLRLAHLLLLLLLLLPLLLRLGHAALVASVLRVCACVRGRAHDWRLCVMMLAKW